MSKDVDGLKQIEKQYHKLQQMSVTQAAIIENNQKVCLSQFLNFHFSHTITAAVGDK